MAAGDMARVIRAPGRLVVNPADNLGEIASTYPYHGVEVGKVNLCALVPAGRAPFLVEYEALGSPGDVLESDVRWMFSCFIRAWDSDAVAQFLSDGYSEGPNTQHAVFSAPGISIPGSSALARAVVLLFVPDDPIHNPGVIMYRAVPNWTESSEMAFRRQDELGIPITFECLRDDDDRILKIGRVADFDTVTVEDWGPGA